MIKYGYNQGGGGLADSSVTSQPVQPIGRVVSAPAFPLKIQEGLAVTNLALATIAKVSSNAGEQIRLVDLAGTPMLEITLGNGSGDLFQADITFESPIFMGFSNSIQFPLYFTDMSATEISGPTVQTWLYTEGTGTNVRPQLSLDSQEPGKIFVESFPRDGLIAGATPITQLDVDRIFKMRLLITAGTSTTPKAKIYVGAPVLNKRLEKGIVQIYADGEYISQHKWLLPMLSAYGLRANLALTNQYIGTDSAVYMDYTQLDYWKQKGHVPVHHTFGTATHGWDNVTDYPTRASITNDLEAQWNNFRIRDWTEGIGHAVNGYTNAFNPSVDVDRQALVSLALSLANLKTCRVGGQYLAATGGVGQLFPAANPNANWRRMVGGIQITNTHTAADGIAVVNAVAQRGEVGNILWHRLVADAATPGALEMTIGNAELIVQHIASLVEAGTIRNNTVNQTWDTFHVGGIYVPSF